jgi:lipoprotein-anchoring transpeptidase ErfK/SrfK
MTLGSRTTHLLLCLAVAAPLLGSVFRTCSPSPSTAPVPQATPTPAPTRASSTPVPAAKTCRRIARIDVWKASHRLKATCENGAELTMTVAIGRGARAAKQESGDARTPEGRYAVAGAARTSRFHLFIPIDYPSVSDAERGLSEGIVDATTHAQILDAHSAGRLPPQDTALGGSIGLHGEGEDWQGESRRSDWTLGCIAVSDDEIERLAERVHVGVPVWIHP